MKRFIFIVMLLFATISFGVTGTNINTTTWQGAQIRGTDLSAQWTLIDDFLTTTLAGLLIDASTITMEGVTADAFETTITFTDPTADNAVAFPDDGGAIMLSTLITNSQDVANSAWFGTNVLIFEGATADAFETSLQPQDPTADNTIIIPDDAGAFTTSTLVTNGQEVANSVWGGTNQWIFEGATADAFETIVTPQDPTADATITIPDDTGTLVTSTLITNGQDIANSVWMGTNQIIMEGATADAFETILTPVDATADATITFPDDSGCIAYTPAGGTTYGAGAGALPLTHTIIIYTSVGGAEALTLADGKDGQIIVITHVTDGGNGVLTPATAAGWTSIDLADAGDTVSMVFVNTVGWAILGTSGNAAPPVVTP